MTTFAQIRDSFLAHFWATHPVDASFAGAGERFDELLPPAGADAAASEKRELAALRDQLDAASVPDEPGARIDAQLMRGYIASTLAQPAQLARFNNPTWYTGEIAFGIIALLLPSDLQRSTAALSQRIAAIPEQLAAASRHLAGAPVPADWVRRARLEIAAIGRLLTVGLPLHPLGAPIAAATIAPALAALADFETRIALLPDADPAAGPEYFALLARDVHGLPETPAEIERIAAAEFARLLDELESAAARLDPAIPWRAQVDALSAPDVSGDAVRAAMAHWHARALSDAAHLVTPADDYDLTFEPMPEWAVPVYADLYFLFYRSPAAYRPGAGSTYWVTAPASTSAIKLIHAVHHGSIGHHTQNARARSSPSLLARIAGSDGAAGIALLGGGSLGEGWACYAEDLLAEVPDFYTPQERLLLLAFELRNVATCLGDLRLHTGTWTLEEMRAFYRDDAAFAAARIWSETTRNSIFPASRIMYWLGTRGIRALRAASPDSAKVFHDRLLSFGAAPVTVIGSELRELAARR